MRLWPFGFDVVVEAAVQRQESADYGKSYDVETVEKTHQDEETGDSYDLTAVAVPHSPFHSQSEGGSIWTVRRMKAPKIR